MTNEIINLEPPLTDEERDQLTKLENVISQNIRAFVKVGFALAIIKNNRLHRETHDTWEQYCKDVWDLKRTHSYRLIDATRVIENLSTMVDKNGNVPNWGHFVEDDHDGNVTHGLQNIICDNTSTPLPINELQCRILASLKPEMQKIAWQKALETLPEGTTMTAAHINKTVQALVGNNDGKDKNPPPRQGHYEVSNKWHGAIQTLIDAFAKAREEGFKDMTKNAALRQLRDLIATIEADDI